MRKFKKFLKNRKLKKLSFPLIIVGVWLLVVITNYSPGTFLTGWDNQHFEFNIGLNLERLLSSVWAEYQGLGAVGAHSHAADLLRILIVGILSSTLPANLVRYSFFFLTLLVGTLGVYFLMKNIILKEYASKYRNVIALISALFYMLNIGTVQQFIVPFEMFATQFALLPWIIYFVIKFLRNPNRKGLLVLLILNIFAAPMAYASMLWIAYLGGLIVFLILYYLINERKYLVRRILAVIGITLIANSFWLLPTIYFVVNHSSSVPEAKTNINFSEEAFLINQKYGTVDNVVQLKGFLFDWDVRNNLGQYNPLMENWSSHTNQPIFIIAALSVFSVSITGIILSIYKRKKTSVPFVAFFAVGFIMMLGLNSPIGQILFKLIGDINALEEALRFPFTKFSILYIFGLSIFLGIGVYYILRFIKKRFKISPNKWVLTIAVISGILIYSYPTFKGEFINQNLRIDIPKEYFALFDYLGTQNPNERIANLPINSLYGWYYTQWGYQGSGFLWYGIKQPILDRDFDRWYDPLEDYYDGMSQAIYTNDVDQLRYVIDKYDLGWILVDENVISLSDPTIQGNNVYNDVEMAFTKTEELISKLDNVSFNKQFGNIKLYKLNTKIKDYVSTSNALIDHDIKLFPVTNTERKNKLYEFTDSGSEIIVEKKYILPEDNLEIKIPSLVDYEDTLKSKILIRKVRNEIQVRLEYISPSIYINEEDYSLKNSLLSEFSVPYSAQNKDQYIIINDQKFNIDSLSGNYSSIGEVDINLKKDNSVELYTSKDPGEVILALNDTSITDCKGDSDVDNISSESNLNSLKISSKNNIACSVFNQRLNIGANELVVVSTKYASSSKIKPNICIRNEGDCLESELVNFNSKEISAFYSSTNSQQLKLSFNLDNISDGVERTITYSDAKLQIYSKVYSQSFKPSIESLSKDQLIKINGKELSLKVSIPYTQENSLTNNRLIAALNNSLRPCAQISKVSQKLIETSPEYNSVNLINKDSSSCIDLDTSSELKNNSSYVILVAGENLTGAQTSFSVIDQKTKHYFVQDRLFRNESMSDLYFVNKVSDGDSNFSVFLQNQGIGNITTENRIDKFVITELPLSWLNNIAISKGSEPISESLEVNKNTNFYYSLSKVSNEYISLSQSFERGWIAIGNNLNILNHQTNTINGKIWNNKWETNNIDSITIVFIPQYLEYMGFLLILVTLLTLSYKYIKTRKYD